MDKDIENIIKRTTAMELAVLISRRLRQEGNYKEALTIMEVVDDYVGSIN